MPAYNSGHFIAASIESIIAQTYTDWELFVVDDCSTDDTVDIVRTYAEHDERIKLLTLDHNVGAGHTRNVGIEAADGRYIAFCDSDDRWLPAKLEKQIAYMTEKDCCLCFGSYIVCNEQGENIGIIKAPDVQTLEDEKHDNKIGFLTAIYDTQKCPKFLMPPMRKRQDWAYLLQIQQKTGTAYAVPDEVIAVYRERESSVSSEKFSLLHYEARVYNIVFDYPMWFAYVYLFTVFMPSYIWKKLQIALYQGKYRHIWAGK